MTMNKWRQEVLKRYFPEDDNPERAQEALAMRMHLYTSGMLSVNDAMKGLSGAISDIVDSMDPLGNSPYDYSEAVNSLMNPDHEVAKAEQESIAWGQALKDYCTNAISELREHLGISFAQALNSPDIHWEMSPEWWMEIKDNMRDVSGALAWENVPDSAKHYLMGFTIALVPEQYPILVYKKPDTAYWPLSDFHTE